MRNHKSLSLVLVITTFGIITTTNKSASAATFWASEHWITLKKDVTVRKIKNVVPIYKSPVVANYTAKRGSHYRVGHYGTNYSWIMYSGKFHSGKHYTYAISPGESGSGWYQLGIHKVKKSPKYKSFHGYRIEARKSLYTHNTFYYQKEHSTLSDYRPTQKSKVIFEYDSHVIPTKHEWDWIHHDYLTEYRYKNGSWHKIETDYVGD